MIKLGPVGAGSPRTTILNAFSFIIVCFWVGVLTLVFLFIDMFALTILYSVLFIYLRIQSKSLSLVNNSEHNTHELVGWRSTLKSSTGAPPPPPKTLTT